MPVFGDEDEEPPFKTGEKAPDVFVSYSFVSASGNESGFGSTVLAGYGGIVTAIGVGRVTDHIRKSKGYKSVVILWWKTLRG